jgi:phosphoglycerate dehydrogenase-like enzyme
LTPEGVSPSIGADHLAREIAMPPETIVFAQGIEMPPHIQSLAGSMKPAGFALRALPPAAKADEIAAAIRDAEYLVGFLRFLPDEAYLDAPRLKLVQVLSAGYDAVNIAGARKAGIPICQNGGANSVAVSEHAVLLILAVYRKLAAFHQNVAAGRWHAGIPRIVDVLELEGKTVGIVGLGNIGEKTARRLRAFDCDLVYYDIARRGAAEEAALGVRFLPFESLLETSDVVTLHVPLNDETRHMIDARALGRMKPRAVLINTCRGEVVDEAALTQALRTGRILGAGLDTFAKEPTDPANPLLALPNVTLTPHSAGPTEESFAKRFRNGYANVERVAAGQRPLWIIPEMRDLFP